MVTYTPGVDYLGTDVFTYTVSAASDLGSDTATVTITEKPAAVAEGSTGAIIGWYSESFSIPLLPIPMGTT